MIFDLLGVKEVLKIFCFAMAEQKIIFHSEQVSLLMIVCETITRLLYPTGWHHVYVPVLPPDLIDFIQAPTPFIMGVYSAFRNHFTSLIDVYIVDLDSRLVHSPKDPSVVFPPTEFLKKLENR